MVLRIPPASLPYRQLNVRLGKVPGEQISMMVSGVKEYYNHGHRGSPKDHCGCQRTRSALGGINVTLGKGRISPVRALRVLTAPRFAAQLDVNGLLPLASSP